MTAIDVFNNMTDEVLKYDMHPEEIKHLCNALSLDLQLAREKKLRTDEYQA